MIKKQKNNIYVFEFEDGSLFIIDGDFDIKESTYVPGYHFIYKADCAAQGLLRKVIIK